MIVNYFSTTLLIISLIPLYILEGDRVAIEIKEELTIGNERGGEIFRIDGIAVDEDQNIYVTDYYDYSIKKFYNEGQYVKKAGGKGRGPGEFQSPATIALYKDTLAIIDLKRPAIQIYNTNLEFIRSFNNPQTFSIDIDINSKAELFVVSYTTNPDDRLVVYDSYGRYIKRIILKQQPSHDVLLNSINVSIDDSDNIYVAHLFLNKIEKYDKNGNFIRNFSISPIYKQAEPAMKKDAPEAFIRSSSICGKYLFILGGRATGKDKRDVYIFNLDGELISSMILPEATRLVGSDKNNRIYLTALEGTILKKYYLLMKK